MRRQRPRAPRTTEGVRLLLGRLERVVQAGDAGAFLALLSDSADRHARARFRSTELMPGASRAVVQERDRQPLPGMLPGNGYRLMVDVLAEFGSRARIATWRLDVKRTAAASPIASGPSPTRSGCRRSKTSIACR